MCKLLKTKVHKSQQSTLNMSLIVANANNKNDLVTTYCSINAWLKCVRLFRFLYCV